MIKKLSVGSLIFTSFLMFIFIYKERVHAQDHPQIKPEVQSELNPELKVMHDFYDKILTLRPVLNSVEELKKKENEKGVSTVLKEFEDRLSVLKKQTQFKTEDRNILIDLFQQHLQSTQQLLSQQNFEGSLQKLRQTTEFCLACHTRFPQNKYPELDWKKDLKAQDPQNVMTTADFYFVTRRYDISINIYDDLLRTFPNNILKTNEIDEVYRRKLLVLARVWRDPHQGVESLSQDLQNQKLPLAVRKSVEVWLKTFKVWSQETKEKQTKNSMAGVKLSRKVLKEVEHYRGPSGFEPYLVNLLRASGMLYEELFQFKNDQIKDKVEGKAEILYLLGKMERYLAQSSFILLSDLYLQECVKLFPESPWGPRCLTEYKNYTHWKFLNSADIPSDIKKIIKDMEDKVSLAAKTKRKVKSTQEKKSSEKN